MRPAPAPTRCSPNSPAEGRIVPLRGLTESQVGQLVEQIAGERAAGDVVRTVHRATNGNPALHRFDHPLARRRGAAPPARVARRGAAVSPGHPAVTPEHARRDANTTHLPRRGVTSPVACRCRHRANVHVAGARHGGRSGAERVCSTCSTMPSTAGRSGSSGSVAGSFAFEHILVRDALYRELEPSRRAELHWRVGNALEEVHRGDLDPHLAELAHHYLLATGPGRDASRAIDYSARAGERAMAQTAYDEAAAHFRRALDTLVSTGRNDPARRCDLLLTLGAARTRSGDMAAGRSTYLEAAALARQLGLGDRLASAAIGYAGVTGYHFSGRRDETLVALLEEALAALPPGDSDDARAPPGPVVGGPLLVRSRRSPLRAQRGGGGDGQAAARSGDACPGHPQPALRAVGAGQLRTTPRRRGAVPDVGVRGQRARARRLGQPLALHRSARRRRRRRGRSRARLPCRAGRASPSTVPARPHDAVPRLCERSCRGASTTASRSPTTPGFRPSAPATRWPARVYGSQMFPVWRQRGELEQLDAFLRTALRSAPPHARDDECAWR